MKNRSTTYKKIAAGAAGVALGGSTLEAAVQGQDFGVTGLSPVGKPFSSGPSKTGEKFKFFFNRAGGFGTKASAAKTNSLGVFFKRVSGTTGATTDPDSGHAFFGEFSTSGAGPTSNRGIGKVAVSSGALIDGSVKFTSSLPIRAFSSITAPASAVGTTDIGPLAGIGRGIIPLVFDPDDGSGEFYGWIDVLMTDTEFTIFGFGVQDTPDTPIIAGQIPEIKSTALLLAMGAAGVACLRRRRKSNEAE